MKKKLFLLAFILAFASILLGCSAITGKSSLSGVKIDENEVESITLFQSNVQDIITLNSEEAKKFIELFNNVREGEIPQGEICTSDTNVTVYYKNGKKTSFYFYGEDYKTLELSAYNKDGDEDERYFFHSNELRDFVYETAKKYSEEG